MSDGPRIPDGYTRGPDLTLAELRPGDEFQARPSARWPYPINARVHKVNRVTFGWEDGAECGKPGERRLWVRKSDVNVLQGAAVVRGNAIHVVSDPRLAPFEAVAPPSEYLKRFAAH